MTAISEHAELMGYLRGKAGQDLLAALPLVTSNIETTPVLEILRGACTATEASLKKVIKKRTCVAAFGSLGRREYVTGASDLDAIIIIDGSVSPALRAKARSAILQPLATMNPWLAFDHRQHVLAGNWDAIDKVDIPYPVIGTDELFSDDCLTLIQQRRWQILLEGRPLMDRKFFHEVYQSLLPQIRRNNGTEIDFRQLTLGAGLFFGRFDNPEYLFKSPFKYFKTRFLRDFFVFATQLVFITGHYVQSSGERLHTKYVRAATVNKMMRAIRFAILLDEECSRNAALTDLLHVEIDDILRAHGLQARAILQFGAGQYKTTPATYLHALLMSVLFRFSSCWETIYEENVREALKKLPKDISVESSFPQEVTNASERTLLRDLSARRDTYRMYMSATAQVIRSVLAHSSASGSATLPSWISDSLDPFVRTPRDV